MMAKTVLKLTRGIVGGIPLAAASSHQAETIRVTPNIRTWGGDVVIVHLGGMLGVAKGGKTPEETSKAQFSAQILTTVPNFGPGRRRRSFSLKMEDLITILLATSFFRSSIYAEMEFVTHVTHGGSVKFLPAV